LCGFFSALFGEAVFLAGFFRHCSGKLFFLRVLFGSGWRQSGRRVLAGSNRGGGFWLVCVFIFLFITIIIIYIELSEPPELTYSTNSQELTYSLNSRLRNPHCEPLTPTAPLNKTRTGSHFPNLPNLLTLRTYLLSELAGTFLLPKLPTSKPAL